MDEELTLALGSEERRVSAGGLLLQASVCLDAMLAGHRRLSTEGDHSRESPGRTTKGSQEELGEKHGEGSAQDHGQRRSFK